MNCPEPLPVCNGVGCWQGCNALPIGWPTHCSLVSTRQQLSGYLSAFRCAGGGGRLKIVSKSPGLALACD